MHFQWLTHPFDHVPLDLLGLSIIRIFQIFALKKLSMFCVSWWVFSIFQAFRLVIVFFQSYLEMRSSSSDLAEFISCRFMIFDSSSFRTRTRVFLSSCSLSSCCSRTFNFLWEFWRSSSSSSSYSGTNNMVNSGSMYYVPTSFIC